MLDGKMAKWEAKLVRLLVPLATVAELSGGGLEERSKPCEDKGEKREEEICHCVLSIVDGSLGHGQ
jgi:hypothetical protein